MSWLVAAVVAYFILAVVNLLDKFLIDNVLKSAKAYAFIVCFLGLLIFVAAPWFLEWPGWGLFSMNILIGFIFAIALWLLYEALQRGEAARILVFIGGTTPVFSLLLSYLIFHEVYRANQYGGILLLLLGVLVIALLPRHRSFASRVLCHLRLSQNHGSGGLWLALFSALAYSLYFLSSKYSYSFQSFASAFIWSRLGAAIFVSFFLLVRRNRREIIASFTSGHSQKRNKGLVFLNQSLGATGFIFQNYAIFLGSVALVNALQGVQYAFLLVISAGLALLAPKLLRETFSWPIVLQKTLAVILVFSGLYLLVR
ncbi:MAG: EamA family transporter [Candidatus Falkowbacteria bacterium]|nr:EamA family transporter [Candidatus Falkowbacteria bacterium]